VKHRDTSRQGVTAALSKGPAQSRATGVLLQLSHPPWETGPGGMPHGQGSTRNQEKAWGPGASGRWWGLK